MSPVAFITCSLWILATLAAAAIGAVRGASAGRGVLAVGRLKSPTIYLFTAYLLIAALVTPRSSGESSSPLLWLSLVIPLAYALATLSSIGAARRSAALAAGLALLHGGAVFAAAALVLALASPAYVPAWLR